MLPKPTVAPAAPLAPVVATTVNVTTIEPVVATTVKLTEFAPVVAVDVREPSVIISPVTVITADVIDVQPSLHTLSPGEKEELIAEISNQTTNEEIDLLKKQLFMKGYTLSINKVNYNNKVLQSIEGTIADKNSKARFVADDFKRVIISKIIYKGGQSGINIRVLDGTVRM